MYTLCFYVPASALETVKLAVFAAGGGRIGRYDHCCWETEGTGQFRPLAGSNPTIGNEGDIQQVAEYRVELVCDAQHISAAVAAMKAAHPYEEPAWHVVETVVDLPD